MRKERKCECCDKIVKDEFICDTCGKDLLVEYLGVPITAAFSYGHPLDGGEYHFCNYTCLLRFIVSELNKQEKKEKTNE